MRFPMNFVGSFTILNTYAYTMVLLIRVRSMSIFLDAFPPESFAEAFRANRSTAINAIAVFLKYLDKLITAVSCNTYQVE